MKRPAAMPPASPFFLGTGRGKRFCLYYPPHAAATRRGALIYVHPFAEEMNKTRRMAALQAKAFAAMGLGVLQIDLFGCGDSDGELGEATWEQWKEDLAVGAQWLNERNPGPLHLWGLRLGAMLALDFASMENAAVRRVLLWQPVLNGASFLTQFLRLKLANAVVSDSKDSSSANVRQLRETLHARGFLEVAGYCLTPALVATLDSLRLEDLVPSGCAIDWFEIVPEQGRGLPPAAKKVLAEWQCKAVDPQIHCVAGSPFWAVQEITECPALLARTCDIFAEAANEHR